MRFVPSRLLNPCLFIVLMFAAAYRLKRLMVLVRPTK